MSALDKHRGKRSRQHAIQSFEASLTFPAKPPVDPDTVTCGCVENGMPSTTVSVGMTDTDTVVTGVVARMPTTGWGFTGATVDKLCATASPS